MRRFAHAASSNHAGRTEFYRPTQEPLLKISEGGGRIDPPIYATGTKAYLGCTYNHRKSQRREKWFWTIISK